MIILLFLGQILPFFGQNWFHENVVNLFSALDKRQYKIIYLSARSICQVDTTRNFLRNVKQNSSILPKGPILLNPNQLFSAFQTECIYKRFDEKLISLENIRSLFGQKNYPFFAGFGNRLNDANTYKMININQSKIFIINSNGEMNETDKGKLSYSLILEKISEFFPNNTHETCLVEPLFD